MSDHDDAHAGQEQGLAARRAALQALAYVDERDAYSTTAVPEAVAALPDARDRRFASHLAYDTLRWEGTLDWILGHVVSRPLSDVEPPIRRILRLGTLQLWRTRVPNRAAVSTAVELARETVPRNRASGAGGFVNGVLRNVSRTLDGLPWPDPQDDLVAHLALTTGHPAWIVEERLAAADADHVRALLEADNVSPGLTLRAVGDRDDLIRELTSLGLVAEPTSAAPEGVRVPGADPRTLDAVTAGRAVPQDEASMLVGHAVGVQPGDTVIDLCAAPGGKAGHLSQMVGPDGRVVAVELHDHRAALVRTTAERLGLPIEVLVGDGRTVDLPDEVDAALVDAPCTGLGTGRRRPEVRWRKRPEDADALAMLQQQLVERAATLVRPGGRLTYAVCTWTTAETVAVAERVEQSTSVSLRRVEMRQLLPSTDDTDGMFHVTWHVGHP